MSAATVQSIVLSLLCVNVFVLAIVNHKLVKVVLDMMVFLRNERKR